MLAIDSKFGNSKRAKKTVTIAPKVHKKSSNAYSLSPSSPKKSPTFLAIRKEESQIIGELSFNGSFMQENLSDDSNTSVDSVS